jgi:hypothetical protein
LARARTGTSRVVRIVTRIIKDNFKCGGREAVIGGTSKELENDN